MDHRILQSFIRSFSISSAVSRIDTGEKLRARFMNKIMTKGIPKKKSWYKTANLPPIPTGLSSVTFGKNKSVPREHNTRRRTVLDKLFTRHITDILSTEDIGRDVYGYGVEITKVQVHPDFGGINVFWLSSNPSKALEAESALHKIGLKLQHELTRLQLMGHVPRVNFVKDKHNSNSMEVEHLLSVADFGDDYVPMNLIQRAMKTSTVENPIDETEINYLRTNLLGVERGKIMDRIEQAMKRSSAAHRTTPIPTPTREEPPTTEQYVTTQTRTKEFSQFVKARQLMQAKILKETCGDVAEFDYNEEELERQRRKAVEEFERKVEFNDLDDAVELKDLDDVMEFNDLDDVGKNWEKER